MSKGRERVLEHESAAGRNCKKNLFKAVQNDKDSGK